MRAQQKLSSPAARAAVGAGLLALAALVVLLARSEGPAGTTASPLTRPTPDGSATGFAAPLDVGSSSAPEPIALESAVAHDLLAQRNAAAAAAVPQAEAAAAESMRDVDVVVVDGSGRPVAGATVAVFSPARKELLAPSPTGSPPLSTSELRMLMRDIESGTLVDFAWGQPASVWTCGADGAVRLRAPTTATPLVATHAEHGSSGVVTVAEHVYGEPPAWMRLELTPRATLEGLVLDKAGRPAPGARVVFKWIRMMREESCRPRMPPAVVADNLGRFRVELDTPYFGQVHAEHEGQSSPDVLARLQPGETAAVELRLPGDFAVTGIVLGPDGAPFPAAEVDLAGWSIQADSVRSDAKGRFRLPLNSACHVVVVAETDSLMPAEEVSVTLSDAQPVVDVVLRLIAPTTISGRVQWADGTPAGRQFVSAHGSFDVAIQLAGSGSGSGPTRVEDRLAFLGSLMDHASTDADGRFVFDAIHPDVPMDLSCTAKGGEAAPVEVEGVPPGSANVLIVLERAAEGSNRLGGRVVDAETGAPITRYELRSSDWRFGPQPFYILSKLAVDSGDGRFELPDLQPGSTYRLFIEAVGYPAQDFGPFAPGPAADVELRLGRHASLAVLVADESGAAQPGAHVQLVADSEAGMSAMNAEVTSRETGGDGRLVWNDLRPGTWTIEAAAGDRRSGRQVLDLPPGRQTSLVLTVGKPIASGALELLALRASGLPCTGAAVRAMQFVEGEGAPSGLAPIYHGVTDDEGRLRFGGLQPGVYYVGVLAAGGFVATQRFEVAAGETVHLTLSASP